MFNEPSLIQALAAYTEEHQEQSLGEPYGANQKSAGLQSALFLRIWSAADYYTSNQQLMKAPLPVDVDISMTTLSKLPTSANRFQVLDPFLLNIFPQSLLPTTAYIVALAIGGFSLSGLAWKQLVRYLDDKQHVD